MLDLIKKELEAKGVFKAELPPILTYIANAIPINTIPQRMKLTIAVAELILFSSHFRRNIQHWNGSLIPVNSITFSLAKSGDGKDSSVNYARKCFESSYNKLNKHREEQAIRQAKAQAANDGVENPNDPATYKEYYRHPAPLFVAPSTVEGFIQHLNDLDYAQVGGGSIYSG
jgi:hypothetical protein